MVHVKYSITVVLFFSLTSVMLCGDYLRVRCLQVQDLQGGRLIRGVLLEGRCYVLISKACSFYSFSIIQEWGILRHKLGRHMFLGAFEFTLEGPSLAGALDPPPVSLLPGSSDFRNHPSLALTHLRNPDGHILTPRGDRHLSCCFTVVISVSIRIEAQWWRDEGCRHWSQTSWVWFLGQPLSS